MKLNKISIKDKIENSKIKFVSMSKYFLGTVALILLAAIVIISLRGMKLGFDFNGGTIVEVVYGVDIEIDEEGTMYSYSEKEISEAVASNVLDFGLKISSYQTEESSFGNRVVFKLTANWDVTDGHVEDLKNNIFDMFEGYDKENIIQSQYVKVYKVEGSARNTAVYSSIALAVAIVILEIWILIRFGLSQALASIITSIINILMVFAFVIICRITVNTAFISSVFITFILTAMLALVFFDKVRGNLKDSNYKEYTKEQHSNLAVKEALNLIILISGIALIGMILVSGFGVAPIREFAIPALFGVVIASLSVIYSLPYFYTIIKFKNKRK